MAPSSTGEPQAKRQKICIQDKFRPGLFDKSFRDMLRNSIQSSKPYPHCKISNLIDQDLLRRVQQEIYKHLHFTTKETDIYKVNQTGDLANLDGLSDLEQQRLPALRELREALSSDIFRNFVSDVTGCGALSPTQMDMSVNTYTAGCHLLNHDDVIGTRRVSFILYMPDEPWYPSDGGALELYPVTERDTPANEPTVSVPPEWNQFCMFTVLPGYSFHSVEEVVAEEKRRLSIQGWFHFPQEGEDGYIEQSVIGIPSLQQIEKPLGAQQEPFCEYTTELATALTKEDREILADWINPDYLKAEFLTKISDKFIEDSAVQLKKFLKEKIWQEIAAATLEADRCDGLTDGKMPPHGVGVRGDWFVQGPPVSQRFLRLSNKSYKEEKTSNIFQRLRSFLETDTFRRWLAIVSDLEPKGYRGMARRFRPGHDFTLATMHQKNRPFLDVTLCLASQEAEKWESCEYGGYECYMAAGEEENDDPATYRSSDEGVLLTIPAGSNELSIVLRDEGVIRFIKYVSARAPGARWDIAYEFDLAA
ncbi:hypothetical protein G6F57_009055 [Rhizopus arrhizus]|uniref:uS12 prolyl 3,4-dihydroxylase n=1 Tax=Rhizopus oryzae TaxID=64495 RepID=A0A9P6X424_RHIOR|nr:hypothetical protein G6F24_008852 [Rhizopus arrhizus]KAG1413048.1 hypothetical protein G6F58_007694 [Rhizopus delemar]KAG0785986.1 hypothetical protein G6F21_008902 [Rhizopus arrhizus]KAG0808578.1 hypothetical protein G6F20_009463 [Rhizopus arrhizus]KAG0825901.1 hypothetical protein G6F19_009570 [Rhizopus arrhizus]